MLSLALGMGSAIAQEAPKTGGTLEIGTVYSTLSALSWAGWTYVNESLTIHEQTFSPEPMPLWPFKFVIPFAGAGLMLQGLVEIARCVICLREGEWPSREQDVEEVDVDKLKEMVHVTDQDIAALDELVLKAEGGERTQ